jgi:hypothetical protein
MSESADRSQPYQVSYAGRVLEELQTLITRAISRGMGPSVLDALKELDRRLRIYPQFGQPLQDLSAQPAQVWIGTVPPFVVHYALDEDRRTVTVGRPLATLPGSGLEP